MVAAAPVRQGRSHGLRQQVIVSLTSYPGRFRTLHLTLKRLLSQSVAPDAVVLWLTAEDEEQLPNRVRKLQSKGLTISICEDLRSFGKIVPALQAYPDACIVTADDDISYARDWLEGLIEACDGEGREIVCHRARKIERDGEQLAPYRSWPLAEPGDDELLATGVGGVLYPPRTLDRLVTDRSLFMSLCPTADDLWLYWMGKRAGAATRLTGCRHRFRTWPGTQGSSRLSQANVAEGENDRALARLAAHFGLPWEWPAREPGQRPLSDH